jgi:hypothetical protein
MLEIYLVSNLIAYMGPPDPMHARAAFCPDLVTMQRWLLALVWMFQAVQLNGGTGGQPVAMSVFFSFADY